MDVKRRTLNNWQLGQVQWFDDKAGEGMIRSENGEQYYVHYSAIDNKAKWKTLKQNKKVKFQVINDATFVQVSKVKDL